MEYEPFVVKNVRENLNKFQSNTNQLTKPSIYKIPNFMREIQPKAFEPMVVSLGPYHHGKPHLRSMERVKIDLFHKFVDTSGLDTGTVVKGVWSLFEQLRGSYDMIGDEWEEKSERFLQLMILDGCFVLQFFHTDCPPLLRNMSFEIHRDMLMLENQLPMKLLNMLCSMAKRTKIGLRAIAFYICRPRLSIPEYVEEQQYLHILDMYRSVLLYPTKEDNFSIDLFDPEFDIMRHATHLHKAGVKFEKSKTNSLDDVSFEGSTLKLPCMVLDSGTETALLNVMAFERLHLETDLKVVSFISFMDNLIDMDQDVSLLASNGIIANALGDDEAAAKLFNIIAKGSFKSASNLSMVNKMVNKHCNKSWNKWSASLKQTYFQSPWTIISVFAAIFGFVIIILQVIYQMLDYYEVSSPN